MSEQSGPITREQVERAIDAAYDCNAPAVYAALGAFWYEREDIPADVRDGWRQVGYLGLRIALTRWHAELAAAEPARRVARWDAELEAYALTPIHDDGHHMTHAVEDAAKARDWGYEIEGGPEPVRDWKSDRAIAAIWPIDIGYVPTDRERYPERPAPRFKVGDRVTSGLGGPWKIGRVEWGRLVPEADCDEWVYHHASGNVSACESVLALAWTPTPASPPAPEVVDVPQPTVKRCACPDIHDDVEAEWRPGEPYLTVTHTTVPLALLRAMLEAIDAQQGGA